MNNLTPLTRALIIANVAVFLLQQAVGDAIIYRFALWPWQTPLFHVWQLVTYAFLHGGFAHIFFNMFGLYMFGLYMFGLYMFGLYMFGLYMFGLYMFGPDVERALGAQRFLIYYFSCVIGAALLFMLVAQLQGTAYGHTLGASGGIFGILLAFGMLFPQRRILLLIPPIPMRAWVFVTLYGLAELFMGVFGIMQDVAHFAHLGGMLAGFLLLMYWRSSLRSERL